MKNLYALAFGVFLAASDLFNLGLIKAIRVGQVANKSWLFLPMVVYAFQPIIFYQGLQHTSLTVLNLLWDVLSDILVTMAGLLYFKESMSMKKHLGIIFAMFAVYLLTSDD